MVRSRYCSTTCLANHTYTSGIPIYTNYDLLFAVYFESRVRQSSFRMTVDSCKLRSVLVSRVYGFENSFKLVQYFGRHQECGCDDFGSSQYTGFDKTGSRRMLHDECHVTGATRSVPQDGRHMTGATKRVLHDGCHKTYVT